MKNKIIFCHPDESQDLLYIYNRWDSRLRGNDKKEA